MPKLFGTDGVRGVANVDLTPELAFKLGFAGAKYTMGPSGSLIVGRDTRRSGMMLQSALVAGVCAAGVDILDVGVLPTPGVAWLTRELGAGGGVVISASHNPAEYNGIKFFDEAGVKLSEEQESDLEEMVGAPREGRAQGAQIGMIRDRTDAVERYVNHICEGSIDGGSALKIALDCANGAAYKIGPEVFRRLGLETEVLADDPDGDNINDNCGSTHMDSLASLVKEGDYDIGIALDGDADRALIVDENGRMIDGDHMMAICALSRQELGQLEPSAVCTTVMTNIGFDIALREHGIDVIKTQVGDRYVLQEMVKRDVTMGGEQSGHIIFLDRNSTGDGLGTAVELLNVMRRTKKPLSELAGVMSTFPQILRNLRADGVKHIAESPSVLAVVAQEHKELGERGRVLVRPSGTEPLIRVMVESDDADLADKVATTICDAIEAQI